MDNAEEINQFLTRLSVLLFTMPLIASLALMVLIWPNDPLRRTATVRELAFVIVMVNTILAMFFGIATQDTAARWVSFLFATVAAWAFAGVSWWEYGRHAWRISSRRLHVMYIGGGLLALILIIVLLIWLF